MAQREGPVGVGNGSTGSSAEKRQCPSRRGMASPGRLDTACELFINGPNKDAGGQLIRFEPACIWKERSMNPMKD